MLFTALAALSTHVPEIVSRNGGIYVDGQPFAPVGYTSHAHLQGPSPHGSRSYEIEVTEGFNSIFTYRGLPGQGEGPWGNETWNDTMSFLDRCAAIGIKVLFDFSQNAMLNVTEPPPLDVIRQAVTKLKDHPAVLSWYLIDEPDGRHYPPAWVAEAASLIRSIDTRRPVSMCFDTTNRGKAGTWQLYVNHTDVVLADIYPVSRRSIACTAATGCNVTKDIGDSIRATIAATNKTTWFVPQAYGSQEGYQREPSAGEARVMVYAALLAGATGSFAFTREDADKTPPVVDRYLHVGTAQPRASPMWSAFRTLALEVSELAPWLISAQPRPRVTASVDGVDSGAFVADDGSVVLVASNTLGDPLPSVRLSLSSLSGVPAARALFGAAGAPATARLLFGPGYREVPLLHDEEATTTGGGGGSGGGWAVVDTMDALSTRVYLIVPTAHPAAVLPAVTNDPLARNLVFNGDLEFATSVGTPDGWMAQWGGDGAATLQHDSSVVRPGSGRHSLRLTSPAAGTGLRAWSFPIKADMIVGEQYALSFWARGGEEDQHLGVGMEAMFGRAEAPCPSGAVAQCSYTPQRVALSFNEWSRHELTAPCRFKPDQTGYNGAAGMVSFELIDSGVAWIDDVVLTLKNNTLV